MQRSLLLVIGHVLTVDVIILAEKMLGRIQKTPALIAGAAFPFPLFRAFLPPLFAPATQAILGERGRLFRLSIFGLKMSPS